jgi:WD40 repeat protein
LSNGKQLALASGDSTVRLWDAMTGKPLQTLKGYTSGVTSVAFSSDGKQLALASRDSTVQL